MKEQFRILFVRTDRIGDTLMNLPAIAALRDKFPKAWITLLTDKSVADLLNDHPDIDECVSVDAAKLSRWPVLLRLAARLRRVRYDAVIVSNPSKSLHVLAWLAGIPRRIGYKRKLGFLLNRTLVSEAVADLHEARRNFELASLLAPLTWPERYGLAPDSELVKRMQNRLGASRRSWVAIHAGSSDPRKRWSGSEFKRLAGMLARDYECGIAIVGAAEEYAEGEAIRSGEPDWLNFCGRITLKELTGLLAAPQMRLLVSTDSGPLHVGWLTGVPVVGLYSADLPGSDPARWGPLNGNSHTLRKRLDTLSADEVYETCKVLIRER